MMASRSETPGFKEEGFPAFLFNFDQFLKMDEAGVFADREGPIELIEGRVMTVAPASADHANVVIDLAVNLANALKASGVVGLKVLSQATLRIGDHSAPEPDVFVARPDHGRRFYEARDAVFVAEVSVTTVQPDQSFKRPLYARAGIPELWILEPGQRSIHVHRHPQSDGDWGETFIVTDGVVSPLFAPEIQIALADVFGGA